MSYILDALKRSEQERAREMVPSVHSLPLEPSAEPRRETMLLLLGSLAVAGGAIAAWLWWQLGDRPDRERVRSMAPALERPAAEPSRPTAGGRSQAPEFTDLGELIAAWPGDPKPADPPAPATVGPAARDAREVREVREVREGDAQTQLNDRKPVKGKMALSPARLAAERLAMKQRGRPKVAAGNDRPGPPGLRRDEAARAEPLASASGQRDTVEFSDLPLAVQQTLPRLSISGYVNYADDAGGPMVAIGDRLVRAGDEVSPGLKVEQITAAGVILSYRGYRFRVGTL